MKRAPCLLPIETYAKEWALRPRPVLGPGIWIAIPKMGIGIALVTDVIRGNTLRRIRKRTYGFPRTSSDFVRGSICDGYARVGGARRNSLSQSNKHTLRRSISLGRPRQFASPERTCRKCTSCVPRISVKADGKDYPVAGSPYFSTVGVQVIDNSSI